jgi:hypothetical protein
MQGAPQTLKSVIVHPVKSDGVSRSFLSHGVTNINGFTGINWRAAKLVHWHASTYAFHVCLYMPAVENFAERINYRDIMNGVYGRSVLHYIYIPAWFSWQSKNRKASLKRWNRCSPLPLPDANHEIRFLFNALCMFTGRVYTYENEALSQQISRVCALVARWNM